MSEELKEITEQIAATRGYLMWGTVDKAYKMLDELQYATHRLAIHVGRMEDELARLNPTDE